MKLLIFGKTGQVACELAKRAPSGVFLSRGQADLRDPNSCAEHITQSDADVVINAAAYTAVDQAETERDQAIDINGTAVAAMAKAAAACDTPFLHISTDYVFDGGGTQARQPNNPTGPLSVYGESKLAGEEAVLAAGGPHIILRTSWVFSAHGKNFVKSMLNLGKTRDELSIVDDQIGGPTAAADIADCLVNLAQAFSMGRGISGIYHFSGAPNVSWKAFAEEVFLQSGLTPRVNSITTAAYPTPAQRPLNSRLDCSSLARDYGIERPDWRRSLTAVLRELGE